MSAVVYKENNLCIVCLSEMRFLFKHREHEYFRCPSCSHVTTLPYPSESELEKHYKEGFRQGNYDVVKRYPLAYQVAMGRLAAMIQSILLCRNTLMSASLLLDIGCFTGEFLSECQKLGTDVYGVELQEEAAAIANIKFPGRILKSDVGKSSYNYFHKKFDIVTLLGCVEHLINPIEVIRSARSLLKDNGYIVIQTPISSSFPAKILNKYWPPYTPVEHIHLFSKKSLFLTLKGLGFKDILMQQHWKILPVSYVYEMFKTFSPLLYKALRSGYAITPALVKDLPLYFYIGESVVFAQNN